MKFLEEKIVLRRINWLFFPLSELIKNKEKIVLLQFFVFSLSSFLNFGKGEKLEWYKTVR